VSIVIETCFYSISICIVIGDPIIKRTDMIPLQTTGLTQPHLFSACPKQFAYVVVFCFVFNDLMLQVLIRFVDVSGIFSITVLNFYY